LADDKEKAEGLAVAGKPAMALAETERREKADAKKGQPVDGIEITKELDDASEQLRVLFVLSVTPNTALASDADAGEPAAASEVAAEPAAEAAPAEPAQEASDAP
jgi:hypothetical protein